MEQRKKEKVHTSTLLTQHLRFTSFKRLFYLTKTLQFNNEGRSLRARLRKMQLIHQFQTVSQQMLRKSMKKATVGIRPIQHGRYAECSIYYLSIILGIIDLFIHLTFKAIYL